MIKQTMLKTSILLSVLFAANSHSFELDKSPRNALATITQDHKLRGDTTSILTKKSVKLMNIKLSNQEKKQLFNNLAEKTNYVVTADKSVPSSINLGMNGVPVLNQGAHGSCVTFAQTAALDAMIAKGDYISQLCSLELGNYLEKQGYMPSGWDGSFGPLVLNQLLNFGYVSKFNQLQKSCAGVYDYPLENEHDIGAAMTLTDYKQLSENKLDDEGDVSWQYIPLMNTFDRFAKAFSNQEEATTTLVNIKKALSSKTRVTMGTLIMSSEQCNAVACGTFKASNDTWLVSDDIQHAPLFLGGHEMVITGYDDNAIVVDSNGKKHQGLLILRNSWGHDVGDKGNFYMTYDYFVSFAMEAQQLIELDD